MNYSFVNSFNTQLRVVFALMMRETHTIYGRTKLGYLWAIIQTAIGIAVMWMFRSICHMSPPHGMSVITFLVVGYALWGILKDGMLKCMKAIESNRSLLTFPQVTPIDVMIARCTVILCTEIVSSITILFFAYILNSKIYISNIGGIIYIIILSFLISLGCGMILSSINSYFPTLERVIPIIFRFLMFCSGVIFSVTPFTARIGEWILWNPILQIIEYTRSCISNGYPSDFVSHAYLIQVAFYSITLGLLLEKFTRKRLMS